MSLDVNRYEEQIRAILQAPGVDLTTISAKRVRKQLLEQNNELTPELVKAYKDDLDALIGLVYEQVSGTSGDGADEEPAQRKYEDEAPSPKPRKAKKEKGLTDEQLARQLQNELNGRDHHTRGATSSKPKAKRGRKAKNATPIGSDGEEIDGESKPKRKGGFTKEYTLRFVFLSPSS